MAGRNAFQRRGRGFFETRLEAAGRGREGDLAFLFTVACFTRMAVCGEVQPSLIWCSLEQMSGQKKCGNWWNSPHRRLTGERVSPMFCQFSPVFSQNVLVNFNQSFTGETVKHSHQFNTGSPTLSELFCMGLTHDPGLLPPRTFTEYIQGKQKITHSL